MFQCFKNTDSKLPNNAIQNHHLVWAQSHFLSVHVTKQGCATKSFNFTISCQVSRKFPPETQRKNALDKERIVTYRG